VQECIPALNALKYFNENASEYAIACAGSLLGITLGKQLSFPVGKVTFLNVYPLSFSEYLKAIDDNLYNYFSQYNTLEPIPDIFFNQLRDHFKKYMITGGLPEVVLTMIEENDYNKIGKVLNDIINAYKIDFSKHPVMKDVAKIGFVWDSLPSQLGKENKKFIYQLVREGARAREYEDALRWLEQSGLIYKIPLSKKPELPISAYDDLTSFKIYMFDVGVLRHTSHLDPIAFIEGNRLFTEFKGALSENVVLQSLVTQFESLPRYWTSKNEAEVDFLIQYRNNIFPAEVKSDENIRSKSLAYYSKTFNPKVRIRYSMKNLSVNEGLINIPLFMADKTKSLLDNLNLLENSAVM
jgi:predicted AAA+ superfamily ATPase